MSLCCYGIHSKDKLYFRQVVIVSDPAFVLSNELAGPFWLSTEINWLSSSLVKYSIFFAKCGWEITVYDLFVSCFPSGVVRSIPTSTRGCRLSRTSPFAIAPSSASCSSVAPPCGTQASTCVAALATTSSTWRSPCWEVSHPGCVPAPVSSPTWTDDTVNVLSDTLHLLDVTLHQTTPQTHLENCLIRFLTAKELQWPSFNKTKTQLRAWMKRYWYCIAPNMQFCRY